MALVSADKIIGIRMKLKVIEFIKDLGFGGAEKIVTDICMFLDKSKFEPVVVVMFDRPDTYNSALFLFTKKQTKLRTCLMNLAEKSFSFLGNLNR